MFSSIPNSTLRLKKFPSIFHNYIMVIRWKLYIYIDKKYSRKYFVKINLNALKPAKHHKTGSSTQPKVAPPLLPLILGSHITKSNRYIIGLLPNIFFKWIHGYNVTTKQKLDYARISSTICICAPKYYTYTVILYLIKKE